MCRRGGSRIVCRRGGSRILLHPRRAGRNRILLSLAEPPNPLPRQRQQLVQVRTRQRRPLRGRLHLHEAAIAHHHDVRIDLGPGVLGVVEVEQRLTIHDPTRHRRDRAVQRAALQPALLAQPQACQGERDVGAGDRSAASAAVGFQDVAVDIDRAFSERIEIHGAAQRAADQALYLHRATVGPPATHITLPAAPGRGRHHRILCGQPPAAPPGHPARHALLGGGGADHPRAARAHQGRPARRAHEVRHNLHRAQLREGAPIVARDGAHASACA